MLAQSSCRLLRALRLGEDPHERLGAGRAHEDAARGRSSSTFRRSTSSTTAAGTSGRSTGTFCFAWA